MNTTTYAMNTPMATGTDGATRQVGACSVAVGSPALVLISGTPIQEGAMRLTCAREEGNADDVNMPAGQVL